MMITRLLLIGLCLGATSEALAWNTGTGPRGGSYAAGPRGAVAEGPRGGVAAEGRYGGAAVRGPAGNAAVRSPYGNSAVRGPEGNVAVTGRGYPAQPVYPVARPPAAVYRPVPVYPGYPAVGAAAAGVAVGAAVAASRPATVLMAPPPPASPMPIGAYYSALPSGCTTEPGPNGTLFRCGGAWLRPEMQGTNVVYVVVPGP